MNKLKAQVFSYIFLQAEIQMKTHASTLLKTKQMFFFMVSLDNKIVGWAWHKNKYLTFSSEQTQAISDR